MLRTAVFVSFVPFLLFSITAINASAAEPATWAFPTDIDPAAPSPIDLRGLNETTAGATGRVHADAAGNLRRGDGQALRLWGVLPWMDAKASDADLARHARFLARLGCNMIRIGGADKGIIPQAEGCAITDIDESYLKLVHRTVAAARREGLYIRLTPFWDHGSVQRIPATWGIEGYQDGDMLNGLLFFEPHLQAGWKAWMRRLMNDVNPATGLALKDDPALAIIQVVSEDTLFFWWFDRIHGGPRAELERRFATWAVKRYGSVAKALETWKQPQPGDDVASGRLALLGMSVLASAAPSADGQRITDQVDFMAETEHAWYTEAKRFLREELGVQALIATSNFGSANAERLDDVQRWAWTAGDLIEINGFYDCSLTGGANTAWRLEAGNTYRARTAVHDPRIPALRRQVVGKPFILSSTVWLPPNPYRPEGPLVNAAYGAMGGLAGELWIGCTHPTYHPTPHASWWNVQGSNPMFTWTISDPTLIAQFPAAALIFRQGLIEPAAVAVHEERTRGAVVRREEPLVSERDGGRLTPVDLPTREAAPVPASAFLAGRVEVAFTETTAANRIADPATLQPQVTIDAQPGIMRLNAPRAQGALGFLAQAGAIQLADLRVECGMAWGGVVAVSLDGAPLATAKRVLVQVTARARPTGWQETVLPDGAIRIDNTGSMPWLVEATEASISLRSENLSTCIELDAHGRERARHPLSRAGGMVTVRLAADCLYAVLE